MTEDLKATISTLESRLQEAERRAEEAERTLGMAADDYHACLEDAGANSITDLAAGFKRAESAERAATALASANEMNERLARALEFYRDAWGFKTNKRHPGLEYFPKEELLDDCGERARALLQSLQANKGDDQ